VPIAPNIGLVPEHNLPIEAGWSWTEWASDHCKFMGADYAALERARTRFVIGVEQSPAAEKEILRGCEAKVRSDSVGQI